MRPTASGIVFLLLGAALTIAAYRFSLPGLLPAGILLVGLVLLSALLVLVAAGRLDVTLAARVRRVDGVPLATVGQETEIEAHVRNRTPLPVGAFSLELVMADGFGPDRTLPLDGLPAGAEAAAGLVVVPTRRGMSGVAEVRLRLAGPFGLVARTRTTRHRLDVAVAVPDQRLRVTGAPRSSAQQSESPHLQKGTSTLDFHTREYVPGDDIRHIHWASTARTGQMMVRERAHEETPLAVVLLDTLGADPEGHGADIAVTAAAAVALHHLERDADVVLWSGGLRVLASGTKGRDAVRLESARHAAGAQVPDGTKVPASAWHVSLCTVSAERADTLAQLLPAGVVRSRFVVDELPDSGVGLDTALFGGALTLPHAWRGGSGGIR